MKKATMFLLGILLLAGVLRFYDLSQESIWGDESKTLDVAQAQTYDEFFERLVALEANPPLYYAFMAFWTRMTGINEVTSRLPSVLFSLGAIGILFLLGKRIYNKEVGLLAAFLMAISLVHVVYAQEARVYAMFIFTTLLLSYFFVDVVKRRSWIPYGIVAAVSMYLHYFSSYIIFMHISILLIFFTKQAKALFKALALAFVLYIPFVPFLFYQVSVWVVLLQDTLIGHGGVPPILGRLGILMFVIPLVIGVVALAFLYLARKPLRKWIRKLAWITHPNTAILALIVLVGGTVLLFETIATPQAITKYTFFVLAYVYLLVAKGLSEFTFKKTAIVILLVAAVTLAGMYYVTPTKQEWKESIAFIEDSNLPLIVCGTAGPIPYYYEGEFTALRPSVDEEVNKQTWNNVGELPDEFWFAQVHCVEKTDNFFKERIEESHISREDAHFTEIDLFKYQKRAE